MALRDLLYRARTPDELAEAVTVAREVGLQYVLIGKGANILVGDRGVRGLVIRSEVQGIDFFDDTGVRVGAGVETYVELIEATVSRGLGGLHHYVGIPSTVGGAMWQNLHFLSPAPERERTCFIEEVVEGAEILTEAGKRERVGFDYFCFGYDYSILHDCGDVVLTVDFRLDPTPRGGTPPSDAREPRVEKLPPPRSSALSLRGVDLLQGPGDRGRTVDRSMRPQGPRP